MPDAVAPSLVPEARLEITRDNSPKLQFPVTTAIITIGRAPDNLLRLDDPQISRYHARLVYEAASRQFTLTDLGSASRTQVNGVELFPRTPLHIDDGDEVQIGVFKLRFCLGACLNQPASGGGGGGPTPAMTVMVKASDLGGMGTLVGIAEVPTLHIITPDGTRDVTLQKQLLTLGRAPENDIVIDAPVVSSRHAQLKRLPHGYEIVDLDSLNGLAVAGQLLKQKTLQHGDVIYIGTSVSLSYQTHKPEVEPLKLLNLKGRDRWTIGRDADNDSVIDHPTVSRHHAKIERRQGGLVVADLGSTNGVFINGQPIRGEQTLKPGDMIRVGPSEFKFNIDETLMHDVETGSALRIDALHLNKVVGKGITLLKDISLPILPREFVVIAGVSGGGKSTLMDALNGFRPATKGNVLVNGTDLYKNFSCYRTSLGYVPQDDIIHKELTVTEAFDYAAQLRMPPDTTRQERQKRINEVLEDLELTPRKDVIVDKLSGGQRKRVSIGVELITKPSLFFLDEATSGLDPGTELKMMLLLRQLADQGRTVLLITHATKNVMMCDKVIFLAYNGRLSYFGPPDAGLPYFKVQEFDQIYNLVQDTGTPDEWDAKFRRSPEYQKFITAPQRHLQGAQDGSVRGARQQPPKVKQASSFQQFFILTSRNLKILSRDRFGLILMLGATPLLGCLNFFLRGDSGRNIFDPAKGDFAASILLLFLTAMTPIIVGSFATMRELVKEAEIYKRERTIGLGLLPYLFSKFTVALVFSLYQAAAFLAVTLIAINVPGGNPEVWLQMYVSIFLGILSAMVMGLLVSGVSKTQNVAPLLTILFLLPQIIFSGGMSASIVQPWSIIKYPFESLITITQMAKDVANDNGGDPDSPSCWQNLTASELDGKSKDDRIQLSKEKREAMTPEAKAKCKCMGKQIFDNPGCRVPGIRSPEKYDPASLNEPEPPRPADPTTPAEQAAHKQKMNDWQDAYGKWKENTTKPIQTAEGLVQRIYEDYNDKIAVDIYKQWLWQLAIIVGMFIVLIFVQKRKDA